MSANEPQTLRDEYSRATKILDSQYKRSSAGLDDVIKTFKNLQVKEHYQLQIIFKNMNICLLENLFTLRL
jgi:hypothetical protein